MYDKSHCVVRLAVHLKGGETIPFASGTEVQALEFGARSTLLAWFKLNALPPDGEQPPARELLYAQIPEHFIWHKNPGEWRRRKRDMTTALTLGRLHTASPAEGARFYLYLLLLHKPGATSFEDLATVVVSNGVAHTYFETKKDTDG